MNFTFRSICLLILIITFCYNTVSAQTRRLCDLEVVCKSPTGSVVNGDNLPLSFEVSNHGPDKMISGDRIIYLLYMLVDGQQKIVQQQIIGGTGNDSLDFSTKIPYGEGIKVNFKLPEQSLPATLDFCVQIFSEVLMSNGDSLRLNYYDPNTNNNVHCQKVMVTSQGSTSIVTVDDGRPNFLLYPNPVKDLLYVDILGMDTKEGLSVTVRDIIGKELVNRQYNTQELSSGKLVLDMNHLPSGVYSISLRTDRAQVAKKLTISR